MNESKDIPIGVSPRHLHLSKVHFLQLFGEGAYFIKRKDLTQGGQFAAEQTVTLATALYKIEQVRVLGPFRDSTQVEISATDAFNLGLNPPVRDSGDHRGTPGITIISPKGIVELIQGVIIAQRHIHMTPQDARAFQVRDKDFVWVAVKSLNDSTDSCPRNLIFGNVLIRVDSSFRLDFHIDTDEGNAGGVKTGDVAYIIPNPYEETVAKDKYYPRKLLYSEKDIRQAKAEGKMIIIEKGTKLTPSAKDYGRLWGVFEDKE